MDLLSNPLSVTENVLYCCVCVTRKRNLNDQGGETDPLGSLYE